MTENHSTQQQQQQQRVEKLRGPIFSITHGAGPLPLEGQQDSLIKVWDQLSSKILAPSRPDAIVVISAHYHSQNPKIMIPKPGDKYFTLKFDYTGFPAQCYKYQFAPRGHLGVANAILQEMKKMPILNDAEIDDSGCVDHGVWVPMLKMLPTKHGEEQFDDLMHYHQRHSSTSTGHHHHSVSSNRTSSSYLSAASSSSRFSAVPSLSSTAFSSVAATVASSAGSSGGVSTTSLQYCDIPLVPVSVSASSDPAVQLAIGEAIRNALLKPLPPSSSYSSSPSSSTSSSASRQNGGDHHHHHQNAVLGERKLNQQTKNTTTSTRAKSVSICVNDEEGINKNISPAFTSNTNTTTSKHRPLPKVAIIASGSINHNFRRQVLFPEKIENAKKRQNRQRKEEEQNFNSNLKRLLSDESLSPEERKQMLLRWRAIPGNSIYQPVRPGKNGSADHFMPMLSVVAASGYQPITSSLTYNYFGAPCSDFIWK